MVVVAAAGGAGGGNPDERVFRVVPVTRFVWGGEER